MIYICNRLWLSSDLQHVDNLVVSDQLVFPNKSYDMVDWSIILWANNHKIGNGTGTGRRTVTLPAPRFFLKITHIDSKFSEMQEGWKESRQQSRFAF